MYMCICQQDQQFSSPVSSPLLPPKVQLIPFKNKLSQPNQTLAPFILNYSPKSLSTISISLPRNRNYCIFN